MGEKQNQPFQLSFNPCLKVDFQGSRVTSDSGLLLVRELDERLGLSALITENIMDDRRGKNTQLPLPDLLRQSIYSRLAGYEDVNDAERLSQDPTFRLIGSEKIWERGAALPSRLRWFETEVLSQEKNLDGLSRINRELLAKAEVVDSFGRVVLDMDSTEIPVYGEQEQSAYNGHFESTCYHPLLLFNGEGDCLAAKLRPGNVHSAENWEEVLLPEIERQQELGKEVVFRADAAFAKPEIYEAMEERGVKYAIRLPANDNLLRDIAELLTRPIGRPSYKPIVWYKGFLYQAASWKTARRHNTSLDASSIFIEAVAYGSGGQDANSVTSADVNGDGKLDLLVVNQCAISSCATGTVGVLLGNGDGTFQPALTYGSGGYQATSVAVADVNGDGKPDLLITNQCGSTCAYGGVSVLLGNGDGTFQTAVSYSTDGVASSVAVVDVNGDGKLDLLTAEGGTLGVLLGNGDGTFRPVVSYYSGADAGGPNSMAVADVNGDGKPDVLIASYTSPGTVGVLIGNGDGTFQSGVTYGADGYYAYSLAVADVNGDGRPDIVVANKCDTYLIDNCSYGIVSVLLGNGDGTFQSAVSYESGGDYADSVAVADMDGDGKTDIIILNNCADLNSGSFCYSYNSEVGIMRGNGDGTFQPPISYMTGASEGMSVAVGDLNGDGLPDLIVAHQCVSSDDCFGVPLGGIVSVLLGKGKGALQGGTNYDTGGLYEYSVTAADVNGDGKLDLLAANSCADSACATGSVGVLLGKGDGTFEPGVSYGSGGQDAIAVATADVNGDGKTDVLVANQCSESSCSNGVLSVLAGNGDGTFQPAVSYSAGGAYARALTVADVNGDGKPDVIIANECSAPKPNCSVGTLGVLLGNGDGTFKPVVTYSSGGFFAVSVAVADVNGDGKPDLLVLNSCSDANCDNGTVGVLLGNGDGTFKKAVVYNSGGRDADALTVADLNGDGNPDLLIDSPCYPSGMNCVFYTGSFNVLLGNGDGTFKPALITETSGSHANGLGLAVADFNGDGKLDVASGDDYLLLGNGDGTFQPYLPLGATGAGIVAGDFNGDGSPDLAVGGITILLGRVSAASSPTTTALTSTINPSVYGQSITLSAMVTTVGAFTPTGTVVFDDGPTLLGTVRLVNGIASFTPASLSAGTHWLSAVYQGDANNRDSKGTLSQLVNQAPTANSVTSNIEPASVNQSITYTASISNAFGAELSGTVTLKAGRRTLGTTAVGQTFTTSFATIGTHPITAIYSGDANNLGSTSSVYEQYVENLPVPTKTQVTTSVSPSVLDSPVTFTATVSSKDGAIPDGEVVAFYNGSTVIGTEKTTQGIAALTISTLSATTHGIRAVFAGDATFKSSYGTVEQEVNRHSTSISLAASPNPSSYGHAVTMTAIVTTTGPTTPTRYVTFYCGAAWLGSGALDSTGTATLSTTRLPVGTNSLTASYGGDSLNARSTSSVLTQTVNWKANSSTPRFTAGRP